MKKIFSTITIFLLIFISQKTSLAFAQGVTIDLEARAIGENITILYKGTSSATVQPILSDKEIFSFPTNLTILPGLEPKLAGLTPTTSWQTKKTLAPDTKYYVRIFDIRTKGFLTENTEVKILSVNLLSANFEKVSAGTYVLAGQIDISKHKDTDPIPYSSIKVSGDIYTKDDSVFILAFPETKVDKDGKYFLNIINNSFNPNTWYEARLSFDSELGARTEKSYSFTTEKGIVPETGKAKDNFYDSNSYRLLAPIPGMTALLDPELCKLEQQKNPGEICDINAFLNFILSLIIGIAAVILVIRLIITGYGYMITDVPFVKAKLKGGFKDALLGLIFALASYVILNTINPRLVSNDFTIGTAVFDIEEDENNIIKDDRFVPDTSLRTNRSCKGKIVDIKTGNGSFIDVCDEIAKKIELMFSDAKKEGIILSGGGFRTFKEQTELYKNNCGGGSRKCSPPTAKPGSSMHETGKAFDLKCDGALITFSTPYKGVKNSATKKCFDWLSKNAHKYGLFNLKKENWHWSVNGK